MAKINSSMPICISIEGNIGAAKSTLLRILESHFGKENIEYVSEPVDIWTNCNGQNLLAAFYEDPKRNSYMFQSAALVTRLILQNKPQIKPIRILERSGLSDHCFAENCKDSGLMNDVEFAAYQTWYDYLIKQSTSPDGILYLRTTPEVCFKRMEQRNRHEESKVSLDYLKQLHNKHEAWLQSDSMTDNVLGLPFVIVDGDHEFEQPNQRQNEIISDVVNFIAHIQNKKFTPKI